MTDHVLHRLKTTRTELRGRWVYLGSCSCGAWSSGFQHVAIECRHAHARHRLEQSNG